MGRIRDFLRDMVRQADLLLLGLCLLTSVFGVVMIYSATRYMETSRYVAVQCAAIAIGVVLFFIVSLIDLGEIMKKMWPWVTLFNLGFILLLKTPLGVADNTGNRAWLDFPLLPVNIQPSEVVKLTFIAVLAFQLIWLRENRTLKKPLDVGFLGAHVLLIFGLYYLISSDMGSGLVFLFIFICMCFVAGVAGRWFAIGGVGGALAFYLLWNEDKIPDYMKNRFLILFDHSIDPLNTGWQQTRSLLALGGGKFTGMGLLRGVQTQSSYSASLPNRHTDFIFSVIGEELGIVGCVAALMLLSAIVIRCIVVARNARSKLDGYVCTGVAAMLIFQIISNIGMCLFIMPVIGLTLPFFSYGGSSVTMLFVAMGMVSGVHGRSLPDWLK